MVWRTDEIPKLQEIIKVVLDISKSEFERIILSGTADDLRNLVRHKTKGLSFEEIEEICNIMTKVGGGTDE